MSVNHLSSSSSSSSELNLSPPQPLWWPPHHQHLNTNFMEEDQASNLTSSYLPLQYPPNYLHATTTANSSWLNPYTHPAPPPPVAENDVAAREHLFEKPLTPSDVGKLNRLVIPKQHAERYFPLGGEAGLLLGFEDESGKSWKFRYSYWNSSQSYVLTKGWSRYVKEKQLDSGDVVLFQRLGERLFIGWRRRADGSNCAGDSGNSAAIRSRGVSGSSSMASNNNNEFQRPVTMSQDQSTSIGNPKRLRLFGVNMECQVDDQSSEPSTPDCSSMSSQGITTHHQHHQLYNSQPAYSYSSSSPSHMDGGITFSGDVNQMRNRRG